MAAKTLDDLSADVREGNKIAKEGLKQSAAEKAKEAENRREDILRQKELVDTLKGLDLKANLTLDGDKPKGSFFNSLLTAIGLGTAALGTLAAGAVAGYLAQYKKVFLDPIFGVGQKKPSIFFRFFNKIKGFFTRGWSNSIKFIDDMTDSLKIKFRNTRLFNLFRKIKGFFGRGFKGITDILDDIGKSIGRVTKGGFIAAKSGLMGTLTKIRNFFKLEGAFKDLGQGIDDLTEFFTGKKFSETKIGKIKNIIRPLAGLFTGLFGMEKVLGEKPPGATKGSKTFGKLFSGTFNIGKALGKILIPLSFIFGAFEAIDDGIAEFERIQKENKLSDAEGLGLAISRGLLTFLDYTILGLPNVLIDIFKWSIGKLGAFLTGDPQVEKDLRKAMGDRTIGDLIYDEVIKPIIEELIPNFIKRTMGMRTEIDEQLRKGGVPTRPAGTTADIATGFLGIGNFISEVAKFIDPTKPEALRALGLDFGQAEFLQRNFRDGLFATGIDQLLGSGNTYVDNRTIDNRNITGGNSIMLKDAAGGDLVPARYGF